MPGSCRRAGSGFTLVELLVTLAILGLAVAAVGTINYMNQRDTIENKLLTELQEQMRSAMDTIVPHLRMGEGLDISVPNQYTVLIPTDAGDDYLFGHEAEVVWQYSSKQELCTNIAALNVTPPDGSGLVSIELVSVSTMKGVQHGLPLKLRTSVFLRNR